MNVLNVPDVERLLRKYAAPALHEPAQRWVLSVARNYILGSLPEKDVQTNYRKVVLTETDDLGCYRAEASMLPPWALKAACEGTLVWFDPIQPSRREIWNVIEIIVRWFNSWPETDTRLRRIDRISFPVAITAAVLWYKDVSENIWNYITDKSVVVRSYEHGYYWVKLVTKLQFEREGQIMNHCVGNGSYYQKWWSNEASEYFSLRDRHNKPHATLEVSFSSGHPLVRKGSVVQCKGNSNHKPDREYQPYIRRFITDMKWDILGDGSHID